MALGGTRTTGPNEPQDVVVVVPDQAQIALGPSGLIMAVPDQAHRAPGPFGVAQHRRSWRMARTYPRLWSAMDPVYHSGRSAANAV